MKVNQIKENPKNPRKISEAALKKLAESIQRDPEYMEIRPIVVNDEGMVLGGNQRLKAIRLLGMEEIPDGWVVKASNLTGEKAKRFILIDNGPPKTSGDWELEMLQFDWGLPELEMVGFDLEEMGIQPPDFQPVAMDEQGRLDEKAKVKCPECGCEFTP